MDTTLGDFMQMCFVVDDIERELSHWTRTLRVGPFFYLPHFPLLEAQYRGQSVSPDLDVAIAFNGTTCVELVRQNDETPSPFRDHVQRRGFGFHHWGISSQSFEEDLRKRVKSGMSVVASASVGIGGRVAYLETESTLGALLELIEITPPVAQFFAMIRAAAQSWDGTEPVQRLSF